MSRAYPGISTKNIPIRALRDVLDEIDLKIRDLDREVAGLGGSSAGGKANKDESFVVLALSGDLDNERQLSTAAPITLVDGGAGASVTVGFDITALAADATPDGAVDFLVTYDDSGAVHKKVLIDNMPAGATDRLTVSGSGRTYTIADDNPDIMLSSSTGKLRITGEVGIGDSTSLPRVNTNLSVGRIETASSGTRTDISARSSLIGQPGGILDHRGFVYVGSFSGTGDMAAVTGFKFAPLFSQSGTIALINGMSFATLMLSGTMEITTQLTNYDSIGVLVAATAETTVSGVARGFFHRGFVAAGTPPTAPFVEYTGDRWALDITADESIYHEHVASGRFPHIRMGDNVKLRLGDTTTPDAEIYYDGSNLILDPDVVGTGRVLIKRTLGLEPVSGDWATPADGDMWYNSSTNKFRARQASVTVDMIGGGGGAGDSYLEWAM